MNAPAQRPCVHVAPAGARAWLGQQRRSPQRDLIEHLLALGPGRVLDTRAVAEATTRPVAELARALFDLNRQQHVKVSAPADTARRGDAPAGLDAALGSLLQGQGRAVIADRDGLCLAACGWRRGDADRAATLAAMRSFPAERGARWWFDTGEVTLAASAPVAPDSPAWVQVARGLLRICGPLRDGAPG